MSMAERTPTAGRRPLTPEEIHCWFELQRETLERLHPSWLPSIEAELLVVARQSGSGRRWLANRLCTSRPLLFALPRGVGPTSAHELTQHQTFRAVLQEPVERALDLGSLAIAARLRTVVSRSAITRLRTLLGLERYERALHIPPARTAPVAVPWLAMQSGDEVEVLVGQALHHGAHELATYAARLHPALGESVRLSFECRWWNGPYPTSLDFQTVKACLNLRTTPNDSSLGSEASP